MSKFEEDIISNTISKTKPFYASVVYNLCLSYLSPTPSYKIAAVKLGKDNVARLLEDFKSGLLEELYNNLPEELFIARYNLQVLADTFNIMTTQPITIVQSAYTNKI